MIFKGQIWDSTLASRCVLYSLFVASGVTDIQISHCLIYKYSNEISLDLPHETCYAQYVDCLRYLHVSFTLSTACLIMKSLHTEIRYYMTVSKEKSIGVGVIDGYSSNSILLEH